MREDLLKELEDEYMALRAENERIERQRANEIREKHPEIQRLKDRRQELIYSRIRNFGGGNPADSGAPLSEQMEELNREIRESLGKAGLPEDYLAPVYRCPLCRDTGYIGETIREQCACMKEAYQRLLSRTIGLEGTREETFENFREKFIPDEMTDNGKVSQRRLTCIARDYCKDWADRYPEHPIRTIVLTGASGLGKTFLLHAMANRLNERGFFALVISAFQFLQTARKSFFEGDNGLDELIGTPVLMLDDLGTEPLMKNVTVEALFNLINERQIRGLATVLSTNLTMEEFRNRYTERIVSRITDLRTCGTIALSGKDLRKIGGVRK